MTFAPLETGFLKTWLYDVHLSMPQPIFLLFLTTIIMFFIISNYKPLWSTQSMQATSLRRPHTPHPLKDVAPKMRHSHCETENRN